MVLIMSKSSITFMNERFQNLNWTISIEYNDSLRVDLSKKTTVIKYDQLLELRDRALLI